MKLKEKFDYADNVLYPGFYEVGLRGFLWPLLSALSLLVLYPIPGRWIYRYVRNEQKKLKEIQQSIDDETPLTRDEAKELKAAIRKVDADSQRELDIRDERIKVLSKDVEDREAQIATLHYQLSEAIAKLTPEPKSSADQPVRDNAPIRRDGEELAEPNLTLSSIQLSLLHNIAGSREGLAVEAAEASAGTELIVAQHNIDELLKLGLIKFMQSYSAKPSRYQATAAGRAILIKSGFV